MARLASESKGGFYATPPKEMALAISRVKVKPGTKVTLLDPCAGQGDALRQFADYLKTLDAAPLTYGVELELDRADKAKENLDHVVKGGYEGLRMTNKTVSCLYLNPPYDWKNEGFINERAERVFLRDLTSPDKYLLDKGLLMFCIPQHVLKDCANLLALRFEDIRVYRFTDENYPVFKQVMVYGYRRKMRPGPESVEIKDWLIELGESGPEALPPLDTPDGVTYTMPEATKDITLFRGSIFDPKEIAEDVDKSPVWDMVDEMLLPPTAKNTVELKPFILPPKLMHVAVAIVAGAAGGNMGGHILIGTTKKVVERKQEYNDKNEEELLIETHKHVTTCRVFTQEGVYTLE